MTRQGDSMRKGPWNGILIVILLLGFGWGSPASAQSNQATTPNQEARNEKQISGHIKELTRKMKADNAKSHPNRQAMSHHYSNDILSVDESARIQVNIVLNPGTIPSDTPPIINAIESLGGFVRLVTEPVGPLQIELYAWIPYDKVEDVVQIADVSAIELIGSAALRTGEVPSIYADPQLFADIARDRFLTSGYGVNVGVISGGIEHLSASVASGDLPSGVLTTPGGAGNLTDDEGTAMLEIIHDLAPDAGLVFGGLSSSAGPADMVTRIDHLANGTTFPITPPCKIIVDDIGWRYGSPLFQDGILSSKIDQVVTGSTDVTYISAAGNDAGSVWDGVPVELSNEVVWWDDGIERTGNQIDVDMFQTVTIVLQWSNIWSTSGSVAMDDYNLKLVDVFDNPVAGATGGTNIQPGTYPQEVLTYNAGGSGAGTFKIIVTHVTNSTLPYPRMKLSVYSSPGTPAVPLQYTYPNYNASGPTGEVSGHAAASHAISVAAYEGPTPNVMASYSSRGPSHIFTFSPTGGIDSDVPRNTPVVSATTNVETKTGRLTHFQNPFTGTSASAPHVAAVAALFRSKLDQHNSAATRGFMQATAGTLAEGTGGVWNAHTGYGKINTYKMLIDGLTDNVSPTVTTTAGNWSFQHVSGTPTIQNDAGVTINPGTTTYLEGQLNMGTPSISGLWVNRGVLIVKSGTRRNGGKIEVTVSGTPGWGRIVLEDPVTKTNTYSGWSVVSVPGDFVNFSKTSIYPTAQSAAYAFEGNAWVSKSVLNTGTGYYIKFPTGTVRSLDVALMDRVVIPVTNGWNLIGSISDPLETVRIEPSSGTTITSKFWEHNFVNSTYTAATVIQPGKAYWVRVSAGSNPTLTLDINSGANTPPSSSPDLPPGANLPAAPLLASPADGAPNQPLSLALGWNAVAGALSYRVQLSVNNFATIIQDHPNLAGTSKTITGLNYNTTYQWRVNATNVFGDGAWSTRSFTTMNNPPPAAPTLSGTVTAGGNPSLSWTSMGSGYTYKVYRYSCLGTPDCGGVGSLRYDGAALAWVDLTTTVGGKTDPYRVWYYVKATNAGGTTPASNKISYFTPMPGEGKTEIGDIENDIPVANSLSPNYPNPFNPSTEIQYSIAADSWVSIKVYTVAGQEVATLVDEYQSVGSRSIVFNASNLPSGIYMYRLIAGNYTEMRKLVLLK